MWAKIAIGLGFVAVFLWLLATAAWQAMKSCPGRSPIASEIDQLHIAIQAYKEKHLVYPPCMAEAEVDVRKRQFLEHLRKLYPSSVYGLSADQFDKLARYIAENYPVQTGSGTVALDLNRLDPAEALVFWLGGFPTPVSTGPGGGQPVAPSRLFGFNKDSDSPLKRSLAQEGNEPISTRTNARFDFRQERLVDQDDDGWWEYVPLPPSSGKLMAPYVYFDSATYRRSSEVAGRIGTVLYPTDANVVARFGTVVPFSKAFDPANKLTLKWHDTDRFQIVCGGYDGVFSAPSTGARVELFPGGATYPGPTFVGPPVECDDEELDNLTNLARTTLSEEEPYADSGPTSPLTVAIALFVAFWTIFCVVSVVKQLTRPKRRIHQAS